MSRNRKRMITAGLALAIVVGGPAVAFAQDALKRAKEMRPDQILLVNLSGRGDKDVQQVAGLLRSGK